MERAKWRKMIRWQRWMTVMLGAGLLISCSQLPLEQLPSANQGERIKLLVMHFTAGNFADSRDVLVDKGGVSAHYLIPAAADPSYPRGDLRIYQLVDESKRAWHAGRSYWQGRSQLNDQSIGIEIVNEPECQATAPGLGVAPQCDYPDFEPAQIELLIALARDILRRNPDISPTRIVGHGDIAPARKIDPGPRFPWYALYQAGIGAWYEPERVEYYRQQFVEAPPTLGLIQRGLRQYGYGVLETGELDEQTRVTLRAFQMHFLPEAVTGWADNHTAAVLFALLERYFPRRLERLMARYEREQATPALAHQPLAPGQLARWFPEAERSDRHWVNDRALFKGYRGRGEIIIDNDNAVSADIYINGEKINIARPMKAAEQYRYSLRRRTRDGDNTLRIDNIQPKGARLHVTIPYPELIDNSQQHADAFARVDKLIETEVAAGFPGAVLLVIKNGEIVKHSAYGYARKYADGGASMTPPTEMRRETLFDLASNTKMFATNLALMKLISEGRVALDKPVHHYLPEYRGEGREARLVRDLLNHRSGYPAQVQFYRPDNALGPGFFSQDPARTRELLLTRVPFAVGRGHRHQYSDINYLLLGLLIERLTGQTLDGYVESEIYGPLKLRNTRYNPLQKGFSPEQFAATEILGSSRGGRRQYDNVRTHVLQGEVHDETAFYSMGGVAGHAGLFATAGDLGILVQVLLNQGGYGEQQLFSPRVMTQFVSPGSADGSYGLGWRRANHGDRRWHFGPYASPRAFGHTGWTGTVTVVDPDHDLAIVLLTNTRHSPVVGDQQHYRFTGKAYETGRYGSVIALVYEALLNGR